jgi:hypothetical protein
MPPEIITHTPAKLLVRLARPFSLLALLCGVCIWFLAIGSGGNSFFLGAIVGYLPFGLIALALWWIPVLVYFLLLIFAWIRRSTLLALAALFMPFLGITLYATRIWHG